ncbi:MAG: ABC-transporter involved in LPS biosynthesis Wzm [Microgenomates group bacterium Gr01-1014_80]|nr:MAG: ABC-transporter involved in LPS biosynthesis Wzm [Microgenomates group bacterium Gr01-1014_80]
MSGIESLAAIYYTPSHKDSVTMFENYLTYKDLFWQLTFREIKARYKQSVLGYAWAILVPLLNLLVLSIVFSYVFRVPTGNIPYPIFLFVALVPWMFLVNSISSATGSVMANASLITKVKLPREILPLTAISSKMIDLLLTIIVLTIFLVIYQIKFQPTLIFVPFIFIVQLCLISGLSFFLAATNVFFRDVENVLGVFLTFWMYLSPVLYSSTLVPKDFQIIFFLNPMTGIINAYRQVILYGNISLGLDFLYSAIFSVVILILGFFYYKKRSLYFADVI